MNKIEHSRIHQNTRYYAISDLIHNKPFPKSILVWLISQKNEILSKQNLTQVDPKSELELEKKSVTVMSVTRLRWSLNNRPSPTSI